MNLPRTGVQARRCFASSANKEIKGYIIRVMTLKGEGKGPLSPLLLQYVELCESYPDYLLLFQVGDFYETFGEEAERFARAINITLTHKTSKDFSTPMAGIPLRSADTYLEKLLAQNIRVALAEQTETPAEAEGLVRREVTQLITPGTVTAESLLRADANYVAAVATEDGYALALLDITTGEFRGAHLYSKNALFDELRRYHPAELLLAPELEAQQEFKRLCAERFSLMLTRGSFSEEEAKDTLAAQFGSVPAGLKGALLRAAGAALHYALSTQQGQLKQVTRFTPYDPSSFMQLGESALATLEIFPGSAYGNHEGRSLLNTIDHTRSAPGRRLLQSWLRHPLLDKNQIVQRQDAVEAFVRSAPLRHGVRKTLYKLHDLERLASKLVSGRATARDLSALSRSLALIPEVQTLLAPRKEPALRALFERLYDLDDVAERIRAALVETPPLKLTEGGMIQTGFDAELDALRAKAEEGRTWIAGLERQERESTRIPTLKIGFNGVFGYYLEITRPYYAQIPSHYQGVQTLKDRQRFVVPELRERERQILRAEDAARLREYQVFNGLRGELEPAAERVRDLGATLAELDCYAALAESAAQGHYCKPTFTEGTLRLVAGRHPVVERYHSFIPNDLLLAHDVRQIILTGPNMSGKSTYLRQAAHIALLAQIGAFVPAEEAALPIFDRIFTRIGAQDDIASGQSTFMVEMSELSSILQQATPLSLVLLDEIGRGTSTFDGLSLAWATAEHLAALGCATLFATHYFELTALEGSLPSVRNFHVAAKEEAGSLTFYHQVLSGPAAKAYGLEVATLAGVPTGVIKRAEAVFALLEARSNDRSDDVLQALLRLDVNRLSPLDALRALQALQNQARGLEPSVREAVSH